MPRILVVEDETAVRNVVRMILIADGYEVIEAEYGLIGYSKAQSENPDLILLDLMMPVMDGFEVLRKLKENPSTRPIPVIILTAKIDSASERECMRLGATDYIKKPWSPRELEDRIGMALGFPDLIRPPKVQVPEPRPETRLESSPENRSEAEEAPSENSDLSQPPESTVHESPADGGPENAENRVARVAQRFRTSSLRIRNFYDDDDLVNRDSSPPPADEEEDPESQDSSETRQFQTRRFRIRPGEGDPGLLI